MLQHGVLSCTHLIKVRRFTVSTCVCVCAHARVYCMVARAFDVPIILDPPPKAPVRVVASADQKGGHRRLVCSVGMALEHERDVPKVSASLCDSPQA